MFRPENNIVAFLALLFRECCYTQYTARRRAWRETSDIDDKGNDMVETKLLMDCVYSEDFIESCRISSALLCRERSLSEKARRLILMP